jgi:response regulator RpfG family c-di-GMP phosphodiesterase
VNKYKLLIADDAELNREILSVMLGDQYDFVFASDGVETLEALEGIEKGERIDLLLLDLHMPNKDGFDVLRVMNEKSWIEQVPVIVISAETDPVIIADAYALGVTDYISRPFQAVIVQNRVKNTLIIHRHEVDLIDLVEKQIYERESINHSLINVFSDIIEMRNHESGSHTLNIQLITRLLLNTMITITDKYPLTYSEISRISTMSALHDIGKIKVPESILNKPGKLTDEEWVIMKAHTTEGDAILSSPMLYQESAFIKTAREICRSHHERYDGSGYPDGLKGDDIPISAQVVSVADVYDALTGERCYKPAFSHDEAIDMILNGECGVFNPLLIECLKKVAPQLKTMNLSDAASHYDFHSDTRTVVNEVLSEHNLPLVHHT